MLKLSIGTSLALATLAAALTTTPSLAGTRHVSAANAVTANQAYAAAPGYAYAGSRLVIVNGQVVGADPDANVRLQLTKDAENANQYPIDLCSTRQSPASRRALLYFGRCHRAPGTGIIGS